MYFSDFFHYNEISEDINSKVEKVYFSSSLQSCNPRSEDPICFGVLEKHQQNMLEQNCSLYWPGNKEEAQRCQLQYPSSTPCDLRIFHNICQLSVLIPECIESQSQTPYLCFICCSVLSTCFSRMFRVSSSVWRSFIHLEQILVYGER